MFKNLKYLGRWLAIAVGIGLLCSAVALAAKPPKLAYQILQLDLVDQGGIAYAESCAEDISDQRQVSRSADSTDEQHPWLPRLLTDPAGQFRMDRCFASVAVRDSTTFRQMMPSSRTAV